MLRYIAHLDLRAQLGHRLPAAAPHIHVADCEWLLWHDPQHHGDVAAAEDQAVDQQQRPEGVPAGAGEKMSNAVQLSIEKVERAAAAEHQAVDQRQRLERILAQAANTDIASKFRDLQATEHLAEMGSRTCQQYIDPSETPVD